MTLATLTTEIPYTLPSGTATTGSLYTFPFRVNQATDLVVTATNLTTGLVSTLVLNSDYTVAGVGSYAGGSITLLDDWQNNTLLLAREVPLTQGTSFVGQGAFFPELHEAAFDKLTMIAQQHQDDFARAPMLPEGTYPSGAVPAPVSGSVLGWASGAWAWLSQASVTLAANLLTAASGMGTSLVMHLAPYTGAVGRLLLLKLGEMLSATDFGVSTAGTAAANTTAMTAALATGKRVFLPNGTYQMNNFTLPAGAYIEGESKAGAVLQFASGQTLGMTTPGYVIPANYTLLNLPSWALAITLRNLTVDMTNMVNASGTMGIGIECGWDHVLDNVAVIDPFADQSLRWGLTFGRNCYTSSVNDCTIGRVQIVGSNLGGNLWFSTTLTFRKWSGWAVNGAYAQDISWFGCTWQKYANKITMGAACSYWTIVGGDVEQGGCFIYSTIACGPVTTIGVAFGGFTGTMYGGPGGVPVGQYLDDFGARPGGSITNLTIASGVATAQISTTISNTTTGVFNVGAPLAGEWVQLSGITGTYAALNGTYVQVTSSNLAANTFTFATALANGTATGTILFLTDNSRGYRYTTMFANALSWDPIANRFLLTARTILGNAQAYTGFQTDGTTERPLIQMNVSNQLQIGDGTHEDFISNGGNLQILPIGGVARGLALMTAAGTATCAHYLATAMPTSGSYNQGDIVFNATPTNAAGVPVGWLRITTGSGNVLNTDWRVFGVTV